jgi:alginate O-acetyltransferase complex protein AlgJ
MKKRILTFIGLALLALSLVPLINLSLGKVQKKPGEAWWHRAVLYNLDFALLEPGTVWLWYFHQPQPGDDRS